MTSPASVLIHVQHLLGSGHAVRAVTIGRALAARGMQVTLATGNRLPPTLDTGGLDVVALPFARALDASFTTIVDDAGIPIDTAWKQNRARMLLDLFAQRRPDILLTETYPFGRRKFRFELAPLIAAAHERAHETLVAASIRDILVRKDDIAKEREMADIVRRSYDVVLVHSDPDMVRLEDSFPFAEKIADLVRYTGFVHTAGDGMPAGRDGTDEVIVSCGGGAVGQTLLACALAARSLSLRADNVVWRLLVGHHLPDESLAGLSDAAPEGIIVERARADFPSLLTRARLSVSQCGYNTALDVLRAGVRAVFVPFAQAQESEQTQRAEALERRGLCITRAENGLTAEGLARAVDDALALPQVAPRPDMNGARICADILVREWEARR